MADIKKYRGGSPSTLNKINMSVVLERIRSGYNISRASLSRELNLSLPTISRIVNTLINKEYVIEVGQGKSSGGKRPIILKFNAKRSYVIGVGVDVNFIDVMLSDLSGNEEKVVYHIFPKEKTSTEMIKTIVTYINKIIEETNVENEKVEVVSLGIPAMVEEKTGLVRLCPTIPDWEGINLSEILSEEIDKDILVDNLSNLSLLGENWKGMAIDAENVVFVGIGTGIGAGILLNGRIYRGTDGSAGEIGYMYIDKNKNMNISYPFGQFEYFASNIALKRKIDELDLFSIKDYEIGEDSIQNILANKDKKYNILEIIDNIAYGISNVVAILNPELVIVRGELFNKSDFCFKYLQDKVKSLIPFKTNIVRSSLNERAVTFGAVKLGIEHLDKKILSPFFH